MGNSAKSVLGVLCVAALISLPTLQAGNSNSQANLVAIAQPQAVPTYQEELLPELDRPLGGPSGLRDQQTRDWQARPAPARATIEVEPAVAATLAPDNGKWVWPTPSKLITSPFGYRSDPFTGGSAFHSGLDLGDGCGTPVAATRPGNVTFAGPAGGYGNRVVVDHGEGIWSAYSHLQQIDVRVGQAVEQSQQLGLVGTTGRSTGCHLHFEIIVNGGFADPLPYLQGQPVADPFTVGNGNIPEAPISEPPSVSDPAPKPVPSDPTDPCAVSDEATDALDSGGLIPVAERKDANGRPCPTPSSSATKNDPTKSDSPTPSDDPSSSSSTPPSGSDPGSSSPTEQTGTDTPSDPPSSSDESPEQPATEPSAELPSSEPEPSGSATQADTAAASSTAAEESSADAGQPVSNGEPTP